MVASMTFMTAVISSPHPTSPILYISYQGGGSSDATPGFEPINNLGMIDMWTAEIINSEVLDLSLISPRALSFRSMIVIDSRLYVVSARLSESRLIVSDLLGEGDALIVWDQKGDDDPWFKHPYGLAYTPAYDPLGPLNANQTRRHAVDPSSAPPPGTLFRRLFTTNQNTTSITWYDVDVTSSHVYRHGLLSDSPLLNAVRGIVYDPATMLLFVASKGANRLVFFDASAFLTTDRNNPPQLTPQLWGPRISGPTFLYADLPNRRLYVGSDDPVLPAVISFDMDSASLLNVYSIPAPSALDLAGPSGITIFNSTLYVASRTSKSIQTFDVKSTDYLGPFITHLADAPECLYLLPPSRFDFSSHIPFRETGGFIAVIVSSVLLLLIGLIAGIAGCWRFWKIEQDRTHFAYQVVDFADED